MAIRKVGDPLSGVYDTTEQLGEPSFVMSNRPDYIILPPELGSKKLYILHIAVNKWQSCPQCKARNVAIREWYLEENMLALETVECCKKYLWTRLSEQSDGK